MTLISPRRLARMKRPTTKKPSSASRRGMRPNPRKEESGRRTMTPRRTRAAPRPSNGTTAARPFWDQPGHTLLWQGQVLKHFKGPPGNQEAVLTAFQKAGWPTVLNVAALGVDKGGRSKKSLHETIHNLNSSLGPVLHFFQEGAGARIGWRATCS